MPLDNFALRPNPSYNSNDVRWLQERNVHIWDKWEINEDGDWIDENTGNVLKHFDPSFAHTIGTAYGFIVKKYVLILFPYSHQSSRHLH